MCVSEKIIYPDRDRSGESMPVQAQKARKIEIVGRAMATSEDHERTE